MVVVIILVLVFVLSVLYVSSKYYLYSGNFVFSRKIAHALIGVMILLSWKIFNGEWFWPTILSLGLTLLFWATNKKEQFPGVQKSWRKSEVYFALSCTVGFASWMVLDFNIGIAAMLFMAWGDGITGIVRYPLYKTQYEKGWAGSAAMLASCLVIASLVHPYWIGASGAVVATYLERQKWVDDNLSAPLGALFLMGLLSWVV